MALRFVAAALVACALSQAVLAQSAPVTNLRLPHIIGDNMVLQAGQPNPLWGWAAPGVAVRAEFLDLQGNVSCQATTTAAPDGRWMLKLPALTSGTVGSLRFTAGSDRKNIQNVIVGETWICGGQSNMTYDFGSDNMEKSQVEAAREEAARADGAIRIFHTDWAVADAPQDDSLGSWFVVTPDRMGGGVFCVAWYFAVALREKIHAPVGLVECAVGGTRVEQWTSQAAVEKLPDGPTVIQRELQYRREIAKQDEPYQQWLLANPTPDLQAKNKAQAPQHFGLPPIVGDLYNGMFHGLEPYGARGVLWYQADGNLGATNIYGEFITGLIKSWRAEFQSPGLPFYYVEMNNMRDDPQSKPVIFNELSQLREAQDAALALPGTDVVSSIDCSIPEPEPHFPNKEPVGRRLATVALDHVYGIKQVCHGPTYASMAAEGDAIRIKFTDADGLRVRGAGQMRGFAIRGATGDWQWAQGKVDGNDVLLWSDQVPQPTAVRYAWAANPVTSMENGAGFPMRPFRTDKESAQ